MDALETDNVMALFEADVGGKSGESNGEPDITAPAQAAKPPLFRYVRRAWTVLPPAACGILCVLLLGRTLYAYFAGALAAARSGGEAAALVLMGIPAAVVSVLSFLVCGAVAVGLVLFLACAADLALQRRVWCRRTGERFWPAKIQK